MHKNGMNRLFQAVLISLLISVFAGCKSAPSAPDASTQNSAATTNGQAGSPSSALSGSSANTNVAKPTTVTLTVKPGREIEVRINETISSKTAEVGDPFTGTLRSPLTTNSGETVIAAGARVSGSVVSVQNRGRFKGAGVLAIELKEVGGHPVSASEYVVSKKGKGKRSAALIGGGAGGGALIGALAGGKKGALFGGLIGGGAGTAGAAFTGNKPLIIPGDSPVVFELSQPLSITVER
jgi:hypothetical protein